MKVKPFNPAEYLQTEEEIAEYLNQAYDDEDPEVFVIALGHVILARGVAEVARRAGLNRESLYKLVSGETRPKWETVHALMRALGLKLRTAA